MLHMDQDRTEAMLDRRGPGPELILTLSVTKRIKQCVKQAAHQ